MTAHQLDTLRRLAAAQDSGVTMSTYLAGPVGFLRSHGWAETREKDGVRCAFVTAEGAVHLLGLIDRERTARRLAEETTLATEPQQLGLWGGS
jgi:hypothetical protein